MHWRPNPARTAAVLLLFLAVLAVPGESALALNPKRPVTHYAREVFRREIGLPQDSVNAVCQSADGYLWLGTDDGLARFDGMTFDVFDQANTSALRQFPISAICESPGGVLWIGTNGGGILRRSPQGWKALGTGDGLPSERVLSLHPGPGEGVWVGTSSGLVCLRGDGTSDGRKFAEIPPGTPVVAFASDGPGKVLIAATSGLFLGRQDSLVPFSPSLPDRAAEPRCLLVGKAGTIWVGTEDGLFDLDGSAWRRRTTEDGLTSNQINALAEDAQGNLWIGTNLGLNRLNGLTVRQLTVKEGLPDNDIKSIMEDREENLWVGTHGGGLVRLKDRIFSALSTTCGLCSDMVWSVFEAPDHTLWIGTEDGLAAYAEGRLEAYKTKDGLAADVVRCVWVDRRGDLWAGTASAGLSRRHEGKWTTLGAPSPIPNDAVMALTEDRKGTLWVGTNGGLATFDGFAWHAITRKDGLPDERVRTILEDHEGVIWIGTYGGGLIKYSDGAFTTYGKKDGLAGENVWTVQQTADGALWIGTGSGLSRYYKGVFRTLTQKDGLFSDVIYAFLPDDHGQVWMSCNKGVSRVPLVALNEAIDGSTKLDGMVPFGVSDGMSASECNGGSQPCGWKALNGKLWFATVRGAMVVDPADMKIDGEPPPVALKGVRVDNSPAPVLDGKVEVAPGHKTLEVGYAGLSFSAPEKVAYRYRLKGFQDEWLQAGLRRTALFTKVPPGTYEFEVQARLANGPWSEPPAHLTLTLEPFFYQTRWFLFLCIMALASLALGAYRMRMRVVHKRQRDLQDLVHQRTRDLQDANLRLAEVNTQLERLSGQDGLTGVANRRSFDAHLDTLWRTLARSGDPIALVMVDLDFFKPFNDTYGHPAGDECLTAVASVLSSAANRASDLVARYGGEEFGIVLSNTDVAGATLVAEQILREIEGLAIPHATSDVASVVTASAGVASAIPSEETSWGTLLETADRALYLAKQEGRNRVRSLG
jgi:diguanylate cyclase (GGDEF)-like protein